MSQISPPIRILLVCAVAFMAAWMLFLRPKDDAGTPAASNPVPADSRPVEAGGQKAESLAGKAVEKANEATAAQDARAEQLAGGAGETAATPSTSSSTATPSAETAAPGTEPAELTQKAAAVGGLPLRVLHALADRKVVVLLFWSPKAAEDKAVRKALTGIDRHKGKVLAQAAHIKRIARFGQITRGADVEQSPTVVVVDRNRKVETLVGYVDRRTIDQAVTDALRNS
jgi:predicted nucleotidyltransferase